MLRLSIIALIFNVENRDERRDLWNCVPLAMLRKVYADHQFVDLAGYLPIGFPGGERGRVSQNCGGIKSRAGKPIRLVTYRQDLVEGFRNEIKDVADLKNIPITVEGLAMSDFEKRLGAKSYEIALTGIDMDYINPTRNFDLFYSKSSDLITTVGNKTLDSLYENFRASLPHSEKRAQLNLMSRSLIENWQVLPLGQYHFSFFFPKAFVLPAEDNVNGVYQIKNIKPAR